MPEHPHEEGHGKNIDRDLNDSHQMIDVNYSRYVIIIHIGFIRKRIIILNY